MDYDRISYNFLCKWCANWRNQKRNVNTKIERTIGSYSSFSLSWKVEHLAIQCASVDSVWIQPKKQINRWMNICAEYQQMDKRSESKPAYSIATTIYRNVHKFHNVTTFTIYHFTIMWVWIKYIHVKRWLWFVVVFDGRNWMAKTRLK